MFQRESENIFNSFNEPFFSLFNCHIFELFQEMLWLRGDHPDSTVENWLSIIILQITAAQPQQPPLEPTYGSLKLASEAKVKGIETGITLLIVDIEKLLQFEKKVPDQTAAAIAAPARNSN